VIVPGHTPEPERHLTRAADAFLRAQALIGAGLEVQPLLDELETARSEIAAGQPLLASEGASDFMCSGVERCRSAADTLHHSLSTLMNDDDMHRFDQEFAADEARWRAWFADAVQVLRTAAAIAAPAPPA